MDDDSPYGLKSPLSSSGSDTASAARRLTKKKRYRHAVGKRKVSTSVSSRDCSSSDNDETMDRSSSRELRNRSSKLQRHVDSSSESDSDPIVRPGKTVKNTSQLSTSSDSSNKLNSSKLSDESAMATCSKHLTEPVSSSSSDSPITFPKKNSKGIFIGSESTNLSSSSPEVVAGSSRRVRRIISESPSSSSDAQNYFSRKTKNSETMSTDDEGPIDYVRTRKKENRLSSTESSDDDDSPSCAICLSSLVNRIAAQISGCTHEFHNICILKWSERTNTCPIDRLKFNRITVKNKLGKIVKITDIEDKSAVAADDEEQEFPDEAVNCVICGSSDNEDVLLLCDGCNRGFHTYCLDPPLASVPEGNWICEHCSPVIMLSDSVYFNDELDISIEDYSDYSNMTDPNASSNEQSDDHNQPSTSSNSRQTRTRAGRYRSASTLTVSVSSRNQNVSRNTRVRQTTITIKQTRKRRKRRRRRQRRNQRSTVSSRSRMLESAIAKKASSGGCSEGATPEARHRTKPIRSEPGRPRLSLFSSDNFEDYYNPNSGSEDEHTTGLGSGPVAVTARTRYPTSQILDRKSAVARLINTNRRPRVAPRVTVPSMSPTSAVNVLDDIMGMMDTESKKTNDKVLIKKDGTFVLPEKIDVNSNKNREKVTETPGYPGTGIPNRPRAHYGSPSGGYQSSAARHHSGVFSSRGISSHFPPRFSNFGGRHNSDNFTFFRSPQGRFRSNAPPRFPRRSLPASLMLIEPEIEQDEPSQADEDVDIYGDIDSTPLVPVENNLPAVLDPPPQPPPGLLDLNPPPAPPADLLNLGSPDDEDKGLIIDDNEYDPADPCDSPEPADNILSLSSDSPSDDLGAIPIPESTPVIHSCALPPPGYVVQIDSDEDCPNSSLYSSTSIAFARNKSKSYNNDSDQDDCTESQVKLSVKKTPEKTNSISLKNTPIRFSIGSKNLALQEPPRKIDLFSEDDDDEDEKSNSDDEKANKEKENSFKSDVVVEEEDKIDNSKPDNDNNDDAAAIIKDSEVSSTDAEVKANDLEVKINDLEENDTDDNEEDLLKQCESLRNDLKEVDEIDELLRSPQSVKDDVINDKDAIIHTPSKEDSLDLPSQKGKDTDKTFEYEISESEKGDENELDKDEVSTQGDILDLNTEHLHGVGDIVIHDGSLPETEKFEDDGKSKPDSFNCLDGLDVDPVSDSEYGSLSDNAEVGKDNKTEKKKKKKRKNTDREEGEIVEPKKKDKKKERSENNENDVGEKKSKKKKDKDHAELSPLREKTLSNNKDNFEKEPGESVAWKKLSKNTKDRNYRDKDENKSKKKKETRKEIERYNVRKVVGDKAFQRKDEFGRDISLSRSRSPSFGRSPPPRKRSPSPEKTRSPVRKNKRRRSRSKSLERFRNAKRSISRSPVRPRKRTRSLSPVKSKDRKFQKNRARSRSRSRRRSRTPKRARTLSRSKQKKRSRSREKVRSKNKKDKNQEVIIPHKSNAKKKKRKQLQRSRSWSKSKRVSKSPRGRSPWDFSSTSISRSPSPVRFTRKSRSWSRDKNLTVIVPNTKKKDKKKYKENKRRKHKDDHSPTLSKEVFTSGDNILVSVNFAHAEKNAPENVTVDKVKPPNKKSKKDIQAIKSAKVRELAAKAKPVAIIDLDVSPFRERTPSPKEVIVLCDSDSENGESGKASELKASSGPKTPPEPHIKFSISSKNQTINTIVNPLLDIDDNKGPNTPPDPPSPLPTSPYDPFDPTKSRSPSPVSQSAPNESDLKPSNDNHEKNQLDLLKPATPIKNSTASPSKVSSITVIDDSTTSNGNTNSKLDEKLVTSSLSTVLPSLPIYTPAMTTNSTRNNIGETIDDIMNIDSDGVYSPASSLADDLFDPPKKSPPTANKKFDSLFVPKSVPSKPLPYEPKHTKPSLPSASNNTPKKSLKYTPTKTKSKTISKLDEDQLKILDEVPSSAVEMQVKNKYMKKLNRQERVVEEVKIVLKPHYNKKHVTKEQYKDILRKSVPKICHNKSGEINPSKIHQLIEAYVKKYRIANKRHKNPNSTANATNNTNAMHNNQNSTNNVGAAKKGKSMWT